MTETVSDIIAARAQTPKGLSGLFVWSMLAHAALAAAVLSWFTHLPAEELPRTVMTISLAGSPGPRNGGLTAMGGRTVQAPVPAAQPPRAETAPAPKAPAMALPTPKARPRPRVDQAPQDATGARPTTGETPSEGPARAETQVRGQGFGLSSGGGAGSGVQLDVGDFCCPEYIEHMVRTIQESWQKNQGVAGSVIMRFTLTRTGTLAGPPQVERSSGFAAHELAAQQALLRVAGTEARLGSLPAAYPNPTLTVHLRFDYFR